MVSVPENVDAIHNIILAERRILAKKYNRLWKYLGNV